MALPRSLRARSIALLVLGLMTAFASGGVAAAEPTAPGSVAGTITSDGAPVEQGFADFYIWPDFGFAGTAWAEPDGTYRMSGLEPGQYVVALGNGTESNFVGYFPELYRDAPYLRNDRATVVEVTGGSVTTGIDADLDRLYADMFGTPFTNDIAWMHWTGLTTGCGDGRFCPAEPVTRGQMAAFLVRALDLTETDPSIEFFDDDSSVFEADIAQLATAGITGGCARLRFCPEDDVTRGQMAAFLVRAMGYSDRGATDFTDDDGSVFEPDIEKLAAAGVTTGCGDGVFCPRASVSRGQMAAFLHRALGGGVLYPGADDRPVRTITTP